jgi:plastocyanin
VRATAHGRALLGLAAAWWLAAGAAPAGTLSGAVSTRTATGATPAPAIVYAEPLDAAAPRRPGTYTLTQKHRTFSPTVLAVPVGSTVDFPNGDPVFHNVFSLSAPEPFDLGLYRGGASRSRTFTRPGTYRVFCNIHPEMTAFIAVVPSPWVTLADTGGRFSLDLPPGRYRLTALSERARPVQAEVTVGAGAAAAPPLQLDESSFVQAPHKNKHGQEYPAANWEKP